MWYLNLGISISVYLDILGIQCEGGIEARVCRPRIPEKQYGFAEEEIPDTLLTIRDSFVCYSDIYMISL